MAGGPGRRPRLALPAPDQYRPVRVESSKAMPLLFCRSMLVAVACTALRAQVDPPTQADARAAARVEIAKSVRELDALLERITAVQDGARRTIDAVKQAEPQAKAADLQGVLMLGVDLQTTLAALGVQLEQQAQTLRALRQKLALEAPVDAIDPMAPVRDRLTAAMREPSLADAQKAVEAIEKELRGDAMKDRPGIGRMLGLARYLVADVLRQRAVVEIKKGKDKDAERMMLRASEKYAEVLSGEDSADSGEGTSLHAAALRRIVQVESSFHEGYKQLAAKQPNVSAHAERVRKHRDAVLDALERLGRLHASALLPDGRGVAEVARSEARGLQ